MRIASYLADVYALQKDVSKPTIGLYRGTIKNLSEWLGKPAEWSDITDDTINRWLVYVATSGVSKTTVANYRRFFLTVWRHAFQNGAAEVPPIRIRKIAVPRTLPEAWSISQMEQLLAACDRLQGREIPVGVSRSAFFRAMVLVMWSTGLRLGDIQSLKRQQIGTDGTVVVSQQKTNWPVICRLSPEAMAAIVQIGHTPGGLIFGGRLSRAPLFRDFREIVKMAGLQGTSKKIRKSGATAVESVNPGSAKSFLGHLTYGLSYRHYVDPTKLGGGQSHPPELGGRAG